MADREPNRDAFVMVDMPGADAGPVNLTVTNPYGVVVIDDDSTTPVGEGRFSYIIPADMMTVSGVWENTWTSATKSIRQPFTVGEQPLLGMTKFDCRMEVCSRLSDIHHGWVTQADIGSIADSTLIGGTGEYIHWWAMRFPDTDDAGRPVRIMAWNGSALELSDPFLSLPVRGEEYVMMKLNPREADRAIRTTMTELAPLSRIEVSYPALPITGGTVLLPRGVHSVVSVLRNTDLVSSTAWELLPGRILNITDSTDDTVISILGLRDATFPVWEDSILDTDSGATIAGASFYLHAHRALGAAIDPEEHLRRQLAAQDEYERMKRNTVGRIPPGTRRVVH